MRVRVRRAHARRAAPCNQIARMAPQRCRWGLCGCTHATQRPNIRRLSMQHACTSVEGPRTTSGAVQSKSHEWRLSDAAGACVGARTLPNDQIYVVCRCSMRVRVRRAHARRAAPCNQIARMAPQRRRWGPCGCTGYPTTKYMSSVDAACVYECGWPTHDERRRAIKSHEWRLSDAAGACVGVRTLPNDQVHVVCRGILCYAPASARTAWPVTCRTSTRLLALPSPSTCALATAAPRALEVSVPERWSERDR
jgi:hypothetical protein